MGAVTMHGVGRSGAIGALMALVMLSLSASDVPAAQVDIVGPAGSQKFGTSVTVLPNGNIVVTDPQATIGGVIRAGAVHLYSPTGELISTVVGSTTYDSVGSGGVVAVGNSNFVVLSPNWSSQSTSRVGAATWVNGTTGLNGSVSGTNSLTGSSTNDTVGMRALALTNGNYVVLSSLWNGVGAATWADGNTSTSAVVSTQNSLHGTTNGDSVGQSATALTNGNYVIVSPGWNNGVPGAKFGAVTWRDGSHAMGEAVSTANSLHGTTTDDRVGIQDVTALSNGNYVVASVDWNNGSPNAKVGAATWGNGSSGIVGAVSTGNSLHGTTANDSVGQGRVLALSDGNYVVLSRLWANGVGAASWGNGTTGGLTGAVSVANSLTGTVAGDEVGQLADALTDGGYVVGSSRWDNSRGAATWCAAGGCVGHVSLANSFVGTAAGANSLFVRALSDGNYAVATPGWSNGALTLLGAATWGAGTTGLFGQPAAGHSLVGATASDRIGDGGIIATRSGSYVVSSTRWHDGNGAQVGAVTWVRGGQPFSGTVTASNSFTGSVSGGIVGYARALGDGNYVIQSTSWRNGGMTDAGAITLASGRCRLVGQVAAWNSVRGGVTNGGGTMVYAYDAAREQLVVGRPAENIVSLFTMEQIFADNFEP